MSLISSARALDDQNFVWRVKGAILQKASTMLGATGNDKNFALTMLINPQITEFSMLAFVAVDTAVSNAIQVDSTGAVNTDAVTDADIVRVVNAQWSKVASKYTKDPLVAGTAPAANTTP